MRIKNPDQLPIKARHVELSLISSADDEPGRPTDRLLAIAIDAAEHARTLSLSDVSERLVQPPHYPDIWPGEHYRLLAGLVRTLNPSTIVEIGTGSGL
ncbi:MAG: hypothetical protein IT290_00520, partial [Deltaproteobacteria bacterium]|nr:hypothetical protein [Deltaproteobacteria bacterium]